MNLNCLRDPIKEKLADIVTDFHKDIEGAQTVTINNNIIIIIIITRPTLIITRTQLLITTCLLYQEGSTGPDRYSITWSNQWKY